jgi:hypothetical protein
MLYRAGDGEAQQRFEIPVPTTARHPVFFDRAVRPG